MSWENVLKNENVKQQIDATIDEMQRGLDVWKQWPVENIIAPKVLIDIVTKYHQQLSKISQSLSDFDKTTPQSHFDKTPQLVDVQTGQEPIQGQKQEYDSATGQWRNV
tara:strand:- start:1439 stop:1762 length:324 start_codon:yes stop_codon:yes gene_type:complete